jgi:tetraacyldisaccharide 4'-kinase
MDIFNKRWLVFWLYPFSLIFRFAVYLRNLLYDVELLQVVRFNTPVISVGNLTVGGTGKTPAVEYLARMLLANHLKPAIITRGYGRTKRGTVVVSDGERILAAVEAGGDEAMLLAKQLPQAVVIADEKKSRGAEYASRNFQIDAVIIDDGFQHRRLHRDFDIVLVDAPSYGTNHGLLPAGPFREPYHALRRAHAVIFTNANQASSGQIEALLGKARASSSAPLFTSVLEPSLLENIFTQKSAPVSSLRGKNVFAASGIARPSRLFDATTELGAKLVGTAAFPDHHAFTKKEILEVVKRSHDANADAIVITEKDAPKWRGQIDAVDLPIFSLRVEFRITGDDMLFSKTVLDCLQHREGKGAG